MRDRLLSSPDLPPLPSSPCGAASMPPMVKLGCANCHAARTTEQRRLGVLKKGHRRINVAASTPGHRRLDIPRMHRSLCADMQRYPPVETPPGYESLQAAARRYGVSERTLRRRIEAGEIEAERVARPQGSVLFVKLPPDAANAATLDPDQKNVQAAKDTASAPPATTDAPALTTRALDIFSAVFKGNLELIREKDVKIAADASTIADLRERVGRAEAARAAAEQRAADLADRLRAAERPWWRWW